MLDEGRELCLFECTFAFHIYTVACIPICSAYCSSVKAKVEAGVCDRCRLFACQLDYAKTTKTNFMQLGEIFFCLCRSEALPLWNTVLTSVTTEPPSSLYLFLHEHMQPSAEVPVYKLVLLQILAALSDVSRHIEKVHHGQAGWLILIKQRRDRKKQILKTDGAHTIALKLNQYDPCNPAT